MDNEKNLNQSEIDNLLNLYQKENYIEAENLATILTKKFPKNPFVWRILGAALKKRGLLSESLIAKQEVINLLPNNSSAYANIGTTLMELGRLEEAKENLKYAVLIDPKFSEAYNNLGSTYKEIGNFKEAQNCYKIAISLNPSFAEANNNLGVIFRELGKLENAEEFYKRAISLNPEFVDAYNNLGNVLKEQGRFIEAENYLRKAINLNSISLEAHKKNLGNVLKELGKYDEAEDNIRNAIDIKSDYYEAHSNLLFLKSINSFNYKNYLKDANLFAKSVNDKINKKFTHWNCNTNPAALKIGFVSGDFKNHPVGYFIEGLLKEISSSFKLYAYSTKPIEDELTFRIKPFFYKWSSIYGKKNDAVAKLIHKDNIHILIDLSGHTANNRLPVFGYKPAPIQFSWLGYFASTGLKEMDYILGDPYVTPYEESSHFVEKIWQLPESYICFTPTNINLKINTLPALSNKYITFGSLNKLSKITDNVISVWARILKASHNSKLFIKDKSFNYQKAREDFVERCSSYNINSKCLILEGSSPRLEYLSKYNKIDIALSPFPYGGGTTSVEGLWMGVPVMTKRGDYFLSHLGESIANNSGLSDWIAEDEDDYVEKVIKFSSDIEALQKLRISLREKLSSSPLFDIQNFAIHFEEAAWGMWKKWKEENIN